MTPRRKLMMLWLAPVLWAAAIFTLSSVSFDIGPTAPGLLERYHLDKVIHVILFGGLAGLILRAFRCGHGLPAPLAVLIAVVATSVYGASDEFHQAFVPGRYPSAADWVADSCGAILAGIGYWKYESRPG